MGAKAEHFRETLQTLDPTLPSPLASPPSAPLMHRLWGLCWKLQAVSFCRPQLTPCPGPAEAHCWVELPLVFAQSPLLASRVFRTLQDSHWPPENLPSQAGSELFPGEKRVCAHPYFTTRNMWEFQGCPPPAQGMSLTSCSTQTVCSPIRRPPRVTVACADVMHVAAVGGAARTPWKAHPMQVYRPHTGASAPDPGLFQGMMGTLLLTAIQRAPQVRAFGTHQGLM